MAGMRLLGQGQWWCKLGNAQGLNPARSIYGYLASPKRGARRSAGSLPGPWMPLVRGGMVLPVVRSVTTWYDCTRGIIRTGLSEARSPSLKADNLNHVAVDSWVEHNPATEFSDFSPSKTSDWFHIKLPTIYTTVWRVPTYLLSYSETLGKNKLDPIREMRESAGKPTQWPGTAWGRYFRSQKRLGHRTRRLTHPPFLAAYIFVQQIPLGQLEVLPW